MMKERDRVEVLLEDLSGKIDSVHELVKDVPEVKSDIKIIKQDSVEIKHRLDLVESAIKDHSHEIMVLKRQ